MVNWPASCNWPASQSFGKMSTWTSVLSWGVHLTKCQPDPSCHLTKCQTGLKSWGDIWPYINLTFHVIWPNVKLALSLGGYIEQMSTWPQVVSLTKPGCNSCLTKYQPDPKPHPRGVNLTKCQPDLKPHPGGVHLTKCQSDPNPRSGEVHLTKCQLGPKSDQMSMPKRRKVIWFFETH